jgi:heme oxygenase (mycobilin-producing)
MSVVKINALTVSGDDGEEMAHRFASRSGAVDQQDGFEGFELLRPTDGRTTWLVITRWRDEDAFQAWVDSPDFTRAHHRSGPPSTPAGHGTPGPAGHGQGPASEVWSFTPAG